MPRRPRSTTETLRPIDVANRYGCAVGKVVSWIESGELRAFNSAAKPNNERPRYLIYPADLHAFEESRRPEPAPEVTRRRRQPTDGITQYV